MEVSKVVIPVAGWGTRSLPATKNIPKEMLPVYNKPVVQYVVEEAMHSGLEDVVFVNNKSKTIIEDHFDYNLALESVLERAGNDDLLQSMRAVGEMVNIISVRQKKQLGLGHAVLCARSVVGNEPFAVMVGDDLVFGTDPGIKQLMDVAANEKLPVIGVMEVPRAMVSRYGIIQGEEFAPGMFRVRDLVEKPSVDQAPSRYAIVGRYVLPPDIFNHLEKQSPGYDGEIQLTDSLKALAKGKGLLAVRIRGQRFDAGNWAEYLSANIYFGLKDESLREELLTKLKAFMPHE